MAGEMSKTLALIKPDAVKAGNAEEIKQLIELHGFNIVAQQKMQVWLVRVAIAHVKELSTVVKAMGRPAA